MYTKFNELQGKIIKKITGLKKHSEEVFFYCESGEIFKQHHVHDCCESVTIEDVCGDIFDIINSEIIIAEEVVHENINPEGIDPKEYQESFTWTFYKLSTKKGSLTIRWYGESNGFYSESVDFEKLEDIWN